MGRKRTTDNNNAHIISYHFALHLCLPSTHSTLPIRPEILTQSTIRKYYIEKSHQFYDKTSVPLLNTHRYCAMNKDSAENVCSEASVAD